MLLMPQRARFSWVVVNMQLSQTTGRIDDVGVRTILQCSRVRQSNQDSILRFKQEAADMRQGSGAKALCLTDKNNTTQTSLQ